MAVVESRSVAGVTRETWDDAGNGTYTEYAADGVTVVLTRPYSQADLDWRTERVAAALSKTNATTLYAQAIQTLGDLLAKQPTMVNWATGVGAPTDAQINAAPASYIRAAFTEEYATRKALLAAFRVLFGQTGSTNVG